MSEVLQTISTTSADGQDTLRSVRFPNFIGFDDQLLFVNAAGEENVSICALNMTSLQWMTIQTQMEMTNENRKCDRFISL